MRCVVDHFHHAAGHAEIAHQLHQLAHYGLEHVFVGACKFDQQDSLWLTNQCGTNGGGEGWVLQRQINHGAVDQLDRCERAIAQLDDVLGGIHRFVKAVKVHHAQYLGARQVAQFERQGLRQAQGAFAANQQVRQVHRAVAGVRPFVLVVENVEVVACDAAHYFGPVGFQFRRQALRQMFDKVANVFRASAACSVGSELQQVAVAQPCIGSQHVVHHVAVGNRATAARVVACHAAQGRLCAGGHIDWKPHTVGFELGIQMVEHHAGLNFDGSRFYVELDDVSDVFAVVNHQAYTRGLAALAAAAAARHDGHVQLSADFQCDGHLVCVTWHKYAHGCDLVN